MVGNTIWDMSMDWHPVMSISHWYAAIDPFGPPSWPVTTFISSTRLMTLDVPGKFKDRQGHIGQHSQLQCGPLTNMAWREWAGQRGASRIGFPPSCFRLSADASLRHGKQPHLSSKNDLSTNFGKTYSCYRLCIQNSFPPRLWRKSSEWITMLEREIFANKVWM